MPRIARIKSSDLTYHVHCRGNNKMTVFQDEVDYRSYMEIVNGYQNKFTFYMYHFALMPNHVHLLFKSESDISCLMHGINLSYAQYYKRKYNHTGHFWQDRFKSHIVQDDTYLMTVARYIERNPLRAGLTNELRQYKFSSYNFYAYGRDCGLRLTPNPLYIALSRHVTERQIRYRNFIGADLQSQIAPRDTSAVLPLINAQFIGTPEFARQLITSKFRERIKPKRGRPAKNQQKLIPNLL